MHISALPQLLSDPQNELSMEFVKSNGELVCISRCVCTSYHSAGRTINIKVLPSGEIRKVVRISILSVNNTPLFL